MATLAEIKARREELEKARAENEAIANKEIPQRRYGIKGATKEQQQAAIERRRIARENLRRIYDGQRALNEAENEIKDYESQAQAYNAEKEAVRLANLALARQRLQQQAEAGVPGVPSRYRDINPLQGLSGRALELFRQHNDENRIPEPKAPEQGEFNLNAGEAAYYDLDTKEVYVKKELSADKPRKTGFTYEPIEAPKAKPSYIDYSQEIQKLKPNEQFFVEISEGGKAYRENPGAYKVSKKPKLVKQFDENLITVLGNANKKTRLNLSIDKISDYGSMAAPSLAGFGSWGIGSKESKAFTKNIIAGTLTDIKQNPSKNIALVGAGYGFGAVARGGSLVINSIRNPVIRGTAKAGYFTAGAGLTGIAAYGFGKDILTSPDLGTAGQKTGVAIKDLAFFGFGASKGAKTIDWLNEPIKVTAEPPKKAQYTSVSLIKNIQQGDKMTNEGSFILAGYKPGRRAVYSKRYNVLLSNFSPFRKPGSKLNKMSLEEAKFLTRGKIVEIEQPKLTLSSTERFFIDNGYIGRPTARRAALPGIVTLSRTPRGRGKLTVTKLEGFMSQDSTTMQYLNPKKLSKQDKAILDAIIKNTGISKDTTFNTGEVITTDILKANPAKLLGYGNRVRRGRLVNLQKSIYNVEMAKEGPGFKEFEIISERLGVADITRPTARNVKPKNILEVKGKTYRAFLELDSPREPTNIIRPSGRMTPQQKLDMAKTEQQVKSLIAGSALKQNNIMRSRPARFTRKGTAAGFSTAGLTSVAASSKAVSAFYGTGQYERTAGGTLPRDFVRPKDIQKGFTVMGTNSREDNAFRTMGNERAITLERGMPKEVTRDISRDITRDITRELQRELQRQQPKQITKQLTRQTVRSPFGFGLRGLPRIPRSPPRTPPIRFPKFGGNAGGRSRTPGYSTLVKRFGKFFQLPGQRSKGEALRFGEQAVNKSLAATFKVKRTGKTILGRPTSYKPSSGIYRAFQVRKGRKIPLRDTFIQKRGQRLNFIPERLALQRARQSKSKKKKGFLDF